MSKINRQQSVWNPGLVAFSVFAQRSILRACFHRRSITSEESERSRLISADHLLNLYLSKQSVLLQMVLG